MFCQKLSEIIKKQNSLVCIGLDSDFRKLPAFLKSEKNPQFLFNKAVIDATHDLICAYKPNTAFYEARGVEGVTDLYKTCQYLKRNYPEIVLIIDAKRADIGSTNNDYAEFVFDYLQADAITLHPYLGQEAVRPFLDRKDKGSIILCRTSNPGAGEFQDLKVEGKPLYQVVAKQVVEKWNANNNCGLVAGAIYPEELGEIRKIAPKLPLLIPGIGAQGGDLEKTIRNGVDEDKGNAIINSSRGIIFASNGKDFAQKAKETAERLKNEINKIRENL
jgi:orotidine-5'-phosphate decarboxylase